MEKGGLAHSLIGEKTRKAGPFGTVEITKKRQMALTYSLKKKLPSFGEQEGDLF
jgi:hypothetical protein